MGVHDVDRYDEVRSALGIPEGEPLFIIRAQDRLSIEILDTYRRDYVQQKLTAHEIPDSSFVDDLEIVTSDFIDWQQRNPDVVKFPD